MPRALPHRLRFPLHASFDGISGISGRWCLVFVGIYWLVNGADGQRERDSLFFLYSGHGGQQPDPHGVEARLVRRCVAATVPWSTLIAPSDYP